MSAMTTRFKVHARNLGILAGRDRSARREVARRYAFDAARQVSSAVVSDGPRHRYLVATADKSLGRTTFSTGEYEYEMMAKAIDFIERHYGKHPVRGRVFVDVGANIGTTSIPAATEWGASAVLSVEPSPDNLRLLKCNAILNDVQDSVVVVQAAVADSNGSLELELSDSNSGDHRVRVSDQPGDYAESDRSTVVVRSIPLDQILSENSIDPESVGVLWVDTQGFEYQVLKSAANLLSHGVPSVIEYWPYGLRRSGGLSGLHDLIAESFESVLDLTTMEQFSAEAIADLEPRYAGHTYTELVLLP